jgi:hypothetical protein
LRIISTIEIAPRADQGHHGGLDVRGKIVALPGQNHMRLAQDPETERMIEEIRLF